MQELLNSPQPAPQPGPPVPGTTGGLPALSGLSVTQNPMAQQLQSMGRGDDKVLVHMTPAEVNSLQGLAMATGGSLTINPQTGLPEAGWLGKLLPTLLGFAGAAFGLPTWAIGLGGAAAGTAATGNLGQGLMMGLQAFGGASLAGGLGVGEAGRKVSEEVAKQAVLQNPTASLVGSNSGTLLGTNTAGALSQTAQTALSKIPGEAAAAVAKTPGILSKTPGFFDKFGMAAKSGMPGGVLSKAAPALATSGLLSGVSAATTPTYSAGKQDKESEFKYVPMAPGKREVRFQTPEQMRASGGAEFTYFTPSNPEPVPVSMLPLYEQEKYRFADGGLAAIPPEGFDDLVTYFGASNPGAITASMYPTSPTSQPSAAARPGGEQIYDFRPKAPTTPTQGGSGSLGGVNYTGGIPGFGGLGNFDFSGLDLSAIRDQLGQNFMQQLPGQLPNYETPVYEAPSNISDYGITQPSYEMPNTLGLYDTTGGMSGMDNLMGGMTGADNLMGGMSDVLQPTYNAANMFNPYDNFGGMSEQLQRGAPTQMLPMDQPVYQVPETLDLYDQGQFAPELSSGQPLLYNLNDEDRFSAYRGFDEYAKGGAVNMRNGSFVVDARTVSELGNGSSNAGIEFLSRMGGKPVRGPGDGVSDSVKAKIGGRQEARVARDEVIFSPDAVRRIGGGSDKRGTQKLYALMKKAHKARKKAARGQDTGVRRGLA